MVMKGWSDLQPGAAKRIPTPLPPIMGALIHKLFTVIETNKIITRENKDFSGKTNLSQLSLWFSWLEVLGSHKCAICISICLIWKVSFQNPAQRRNKDSAARQRRMTSFSRDPMFVIPAPYSGRPVCVGLVGMKRYQGAEDGCFLQKKSDTTSCLRSFSSAKYLNSSPLDYLSHPGPFFQALVSISDL